MGPVFRTVAVHSDANLRRALQVVQALQMPALEKEIS